MSVARLVPNWKPILLRWHRTDFRLIWRIKSRSYKPAHRLDPDTIALIQRLARVNRLWGPERICAQD